jgi:membrane protein DedA with SNARE-associated domain
MVPPIPADTFVLIGSALAAAGRASPGLVFLWTWTANVVGALLIYGTAYRFGNRFFLTRVGRRLLHPRQLEEIGRFYARWGWPAIFISRFLPGLRAVVPVFAGVAQVRSARFVLPVASASAIWYGFLVWLGAVAGHNWEVVVAIMSRLGVLLLAVAAALGAGIAIWWLRTRHG